MEGFGKDRNDYLKRRLNDEDYDSPDNPGTSNVAEVLVGCVKFTLDVSQEMEEIKSSIPEDGRAYRSEVISNAIDMSSQEKLAASYQNDDYEMARRRKEAEIGNSVRDNKTKNVVCFGLAIAVIFFAINPNTRAFLNTGWHALRKAI